MKIDMMKIHIGIDDTDSKTGMCTTYLGAVLCDGLEDFSTITELRLVRLNPNIPWKTRGNGAIALTLETADYDRAIGDVIDVVEKYSELEVEGTNPGVVALQGEVGPGLMDFYYKALRDIATIEEAEKLAAKHDCETFKFNNGRGIIGALAAIGADLSQHTFELISYRRKQSWGRKRKVDVDSVFEMDRKTYPQTFNNIDPETSQILITPRSPCPVLFGIRAKTKEILKVASQIVLPNEPKERTALFKSNQGTDAHLTPKPISQLRAFSSAIVKGTVCRDPKTLKGGHVIFSISENGSIIDCAAYEPTGNFRQRVRGLRRGDFVKVYGGVKENLKLTLNLEKLEILDLKKCFREKNPMCPQCKKRMESAGKDQGYRCKTCRTTSPNKESIAVKRELTCGLYSVPPRAMRHLSKPLINK
jgi:tRNA(Ile2)-agmatinylcytidine synthase